MSGGRMGTVSRALALPHGLLVAEVAWRSFRTGVGSVTLARDLLRGPTPLRGSLAWSPFLIGGRPRPAPGTLDAAAVAACLEEAEAALKGRFPVLGHGELDFGTPPAWHADPVSGASWPVVHHSRAGRTRPAGADIKVPWEASRMHWLVALARASAYSGDDRYRSGAQRWLDAWMRENPVGWGVNWANTMEVAIRAVNLVWAAEIFHDQALTRRIGPLLLRHGRHIVEHLEYSPSLTSNHYLADLVGLLYVGAALRHRPAGRRWRRFAVGALRREVLKQFDEDGANHEGSTGYHRLSTELVLFALLALDRLGTPPPAAVADRFAAALRVLAALRKPDGLLPAVGDDDSGTVVNLASDRDPRDPAPLLEAGRALLAPATARPSGQELPAWTTGVGVPSDPVPAAASMPRSGRYVLANTAFWCLMECGDVGQRGNGGHAHNDTLSFVLAAADKELVTDPGTGVYTRDVAMRDRFRRTRAHATVEIDGEEINPIEDGAVFRLPGVDRPVVEQVCLTGTPQRVTARHVGYRRLDDPVIHRRTIELDGASLAVTDELLCRGRHRAVVSLPLTPGTAVEERTDRWLLRRGPVTVALHRSDGAPVQLAPTDLEVSSRYGAVAPSVCLRGAVAVVGTTSWTFVFTLVEAGT
jgi:hypothetical protein